MAEQSCQDCNKYLGEIRDAKLRKGIRHYCEDCDRRNRAARRLSEAAGQGAIRSATCSLGSGIRGVRMADIADESVDYQERLNAHALANRRRTCRGRIVACGAARQTTGGMMDTQSARTAWRATDGS